MAAQILNGRLTADHSGPLVVFIIGMRINQFWRINKWLPVARAMGPMIAEAMSNPKSGMLGYEFALQGLRTISVIQYWRDFDSLEAYARDRNQLHMPAWKAFNQAVGADGTVGIFHETYHVERGGFETLYGNMPLFGLGKVAGVVPATGSRNEARDRMKTSGGEK